MARMKKQQSKFDNKFKSVSPVDRRKTDVRDERKIIGGLPLLSLNFKDFDFRQCPPGQTLEQWQEDGRLSALMQKFVDVCACNRIEAEQMKLLKVYGNFPANSEFRVPSHICGEVEWGTIQRIGGQKARLAGYIVDSVFYPVFLDKDHRFYPSKR